MARIAYFQAFSGISGDMTLGALVDSGLALDVLARELGGLDLEGFRVEADKVRRGALHSTRLRVRVESDKSKPGDGAESESHPHEHRRHHRAHHHHHDSPTASGATAHRGLSDILELIRRSRLPREVQDNAEAVFRRLGEAEARVHGVSVEEVHFHEVGAVDSIVDIVGCCLALHLMGVEEVYASPVSIGTGSVRGSHGDLPLPAPATLELLKGVPVRQVESGYELTTPTGAALLTALSTGFGPLPPCRPTAIGYGAGDDRPGATPNVLRVVVAESASHPAGTDRVLLFETNIDDMSPEWLGHLIDELFEAGALDVFVTPILMKKSRLAQQISVIAPLDSKQKVADTLFRESTTLGVRLSEVERLILSRKTCTVETPWGRVRVKVGSRDGEEVTAAPEYEDLRQAAAKAPLPLKDVHRHVLELFWSSRRSVD